MTGGDHDVTASLDAIRDALGSVREKLSRPPSAQDSSPKASLYMRRMLDVSRRLTCTLDLKGVLDLAIDALVELFSAERGFLILREEGGNLEFDIARDATLGRIEDATRQVSRSILSEVMSTQQSVLVGDALVDERYKDRLSVLDLGLRSAMCAPLMGVNGVVGAIYIDHLAVTGRFAEGDLQLLSLFANQVGTAIENARLFRKQAERVVGMELLFRAGHVVLAHPNQEDSLTAMLREVTSRGFACGAALLLRGPAASADGSGVPWQVIARSGLDALFDTPAAIAALSGATSGAPLTLATPQIADVALRQACSLGGLTHVAALPVGTHAEAEWIAVFARSDSRAFSGEDMELARVLADEAGLALRNLSLFGQLQKANEDLRQAQEIVLQEERLHALGRMASGIVHDVNNVLTAVVGYSELLFETRKEWDPADRARLEMVVLGARDIASTVARLREFYRGRADREPLVPVRVPLLVAEAVSLTRPRWRDVPLRQGVVIEVIQDIPGNTPLVLGVESELREALANLIINAVDAMPAGGRLLLRARPAGSVVVLEVADTGTGMTEEVRRRCFEPFFTTKKQRGTGMGMSVVHGIVRRHHGEIHIDSTIGKGTTFTIRLPVTQLQLPPETRVASSAKPSRILCVDDEPAVRRLLHELLTHSGHTVEVVDGGQAGIDAFCGGRHDLVITDLGMPDVDGAKVAATVKAQSPSTPVILLTGWGSREDSDDGVPPQVDCVLSKPVSLLDLNRALLELLGP